MRSRSFHKVFGRLLSREIFHDWAQSLAIVSIGAIAVTLFVGLQANSASMEERLNEMISVAKPADIYVATDPRSLKAEDDSDRILSCLGDEDYLESRFLTYCNMESHNVALVCSYSLPTISTPYDVTKTTDSSSTNYCYIDETIAYDLAEKNKDVEVLGREVEFSFDLTGFGIDASTLGLLDSFVREGKENPFRTGTLPFYSTVTGIMRHPENTTKANPMPLLTLVSNKVFHRAIVDSLTDFFTPLGARLIYREGFFNLLGWGDGELEGSVVNFPRLTNI